MKAICRQTSKMSSNFFPVLLWPQVLLACLPMRYRKVGDRGHFPHLPHTNTSRDFDSNATITTSGASAATSTPSRAPSIKVEEMFRCQHQHNRWLPLTHCPPFLLVAATPPALSTSPPTYPPVFHIPKLTVLYQTNLKSPSSLSYTPHDTSCPAFDS